MEDNNIAIRISHVSKEYRLGMIGGATLRQELQSRFAKLRGKEDPNLKIGQKAHEKNERFFALDDVSLEIRKGERIGIIGHNGAGKSTLLKLICRVTAPTKGEICMNGRVTSMLEVGTGFHGELTGRENVYLNGAILGLTKAEIDKKYDEIVEFSEVGQFIDTPVKRYSSGMHVKLGFAVASHLDSEIMIMDEVLAVGDMAFQKKCITRMRKAAEDEGRTILYVSHNMRTIRELCSRCIVLDHGKIVFDGDPEEAIDLYIPKPEEKNYKKIWHFTSADKESYLKNRDILIDSFEFLGSENAFMIPERSNLHFRIQISSKEENKRVCLRSVINNNDEQTTIGTTSTIPGELLLKRGVNVFEGTYPMDLLMPGRYRMNLVLYCADQYGFDMLYDSLNKEIPFMVIGDKLLNGIEWQSWWGKLHLPDILITKNYEFKHNPHKDPR